MAETSNATNESNEKRERAKPVHTIAEAYYGSAASKYRPPPGYSHRGYRERAERGELPGHRLPGRAGWVVSVAEWDEWVRAQQRPPADSIEIAVRARFKCAS